jgi:hypothetical protein
MKLLAAFAAALAPALALACPVCAQGDRPDATLFIGALIAAPYLVAAVVVRVVRAAGEDP